MKQQTLQATIALFIVTIAWGITFPLIHDAISHITPVHFVLFRMFISAIVFSPILWIYRKQLRWPLIKATFFLGLFESCCYVCQTMGLQTTGSAHSAFITAYSVVLIPFLAPLFRLPKPTTFDYLSAIICSLGIIVLTGANLHINQGDIWTLLCALSYALAVNTLQVITQHNYKPSNIVALQIAWCIPLPLTISIFQATPLHIHTMTSSIVFALLFCSLASTCLTFYLQSRYQKYLPVSRVAVIYAFEPVFATLFGYAINHEHFTANMCLRWNDYVIWIYFIKSTNIFYKE